MRRALAAAALVAVSVLVAPRAARATSVEEFPDNGSEQEGRGGAWVARASDPLATFYNPAGLAGQPTRLTLQANISSQNTCFTRVKATGDSTADGVTPGGQYPQVCSSGAFFPDPQLAFTYRLTDRIGLGIAVLGPSAVGATTWPEFVNGSTPAPQRYLLISTNALLLTPTIGVGWEAAEGLRLGASFIFGTAPSIDFVNAAPGQNASNSLPSSNDIRNELKAKDPFFPGFTLGAIWSPTHELDVAGWFKWMSDVNATGDVITAANYFTPAVAKGDKSNVVYGDTAEPYCYTLPKNGQPINPTDKPVCDGGNNGTVKVPIPMEAKLGIRYHKLRSDVPYDPHKRDPMATDVFDVEADFTWANDSAFDNLQIRFSSGTAGTGIPANPGIPAATIPTNADVRHHFRDVFGVRLGGDYNVLPDRLALRAGGFFETKAADSTYQNIDFDGAQRFGLALGGTYRIHLGDQGQAIELMAAYGHVFFASLNNDNPNGPGTPALTGIACLNNGTPPPNGVCPGGSQAYRTPWPVNVGDITSQINVINVGASYKF